MPSAVEGVALVETGWAKINLALHIRARRPDGYHALETLFAFAADGDRLTAAPAEDLSLKLSGPFAAALAGGNPADNLVLRAAQAVRAAFGVTAGAAVHLDKRLPVASGIGGGSADAAAALRLLARLWGLPANDARLAAIAATLGADVPACLLSITTRGEARGDVLAAVDGSAFAGTPLLLVNPGVGLSTAAVFAGWNGVDRGALAEGDPLKAALGGRNDLQPPALALVPEIGAVLARLGATGGVRLARMSGSGATCFALFADQAARDVAARSIAAEQPNWWLLATSIR